MNGKKRKSGFYHWNENTGGSGYMYVLKQSEGENDGRNFTVRHIGVGRSFALEDLA